MFYANANVSSTIIYSTSTLSRSDPGRRSNLSYISLTYFLFKFPEAGNKLRSIIHCTTAAYAYVLCSIIRSTSSSLSNTVSISRVPTSFSSISTNTLSSSSNNCLHSSLSTAFSISSHFVSTTFSVSSRVLSTTNTGLFLFSRLVCL